MRSLAVIFVVFAAAPVFAGDRFATTSWSSVTTALRIATRFWTGRPRPSRG